MLKFRFAHRVKVYRGFAVIYKSAAATEHLLNSGLATVRKKVSKFTITEVELTPAATGYMQGCVRLDQLELHPGSFGVRVETFPSGLHCFDHRNPWDRVVARDARSASLAM